MLDSQFNKPGGKYMVGKATVNFQELTMVILKQDRKYRKQRKLESIQEKQILA